MDEEIVDILIIGAGASGAAMAWRLADTRMNVLCLEQGDWMNPTDRVPRHAPRHTNARNGRSR
jgi:choline dehydrogenase-like flavoprotein